MEGDNIYGLDFQAIVIKLISNYFRSDPTMQGLFWGFSALLKFEYHQTIDTEKSREFGVKKNKERKEKCFVPVTGLLHCPKMQKNPIPFKSQFYLISISRNQ